MLIKVNHAGSEPIYEQIYRQIVVGVNSGVLAPGDPLSPIRALSSSLGVSPGTVARAYEMLAELGLTKTNRRGGTTIEDDAKICAQKSWRRDLNRVALEATALGATVEEIQKTLADTLASIAPSIEG